VRRLRGRVTLDARTLGKSLARRHHGLVWRRCNAARSFRHRARSPGHDLDVVWPSRDAAQIIAMPPFTCRVWPVTYAASSLAR
jgi:hypothetical protein